MSVIRSFDPVVGKEPTTLILGSMPSVKSLEQGQYYAHQRNMFWKMLFDLMGEAYSADYSVKKELLKSHGIALWDVLQACERHGSLDSAIKNEKANDFESFFAQYPSIRKIIFNGGKAYDSFRKHVGFDEERFDYIKVPSTSPAHAVSYEKKREVWEKAILF